MRTQQRLTGAYERARLVLFDDSSRYVFMSDCHRGVGNLSDEFTRNENVYLHALAHYLCEGFTYVEVGDGDELWEHPDFRHVKNAHIDSFDAIQRFFDAGRLIVIWGNHNNYLRDCAYVRRHLYATAEEDANASMYFLCGVEPCEAVVLKHRDTGQEIVVLHGHQGDFANDQAWFPTMLSVRYFWRHLHALGVRNPASPSKNTLKRHKIERRYSTWIAAHRRALICGHTHRYKYPCSGEQAYFNTGCCVYPTGITALELAEGAICLVRWHILADVDGVLRVDRQVLGGPDPIGSFCVA